MKPELDRTGARPRLTGTDPKPFTDDAKRILRAAMKRRGFTFKQLAAAMEAQEEASPGSVQTLINKVNRGRFSFAFFLRATRAMGALSVDVTPLEDSAVRESKQVHTGRGTQGGR